MANRDTKTPDDPRNALVEASTRAGGGCTARGLLHADDTIPSTPAQRYACDHTSHTGFDPTAHGLSLPNRFLLGSRGRWVYGLCGGLCYAALDYWAMGLPPPPHDDPAHLPPSLLSYLRRRQLVSMAPRHLAELAWWLLASDTSIAQRLATRIVPKICAALDAGRPTPLMLVRTRGLRAPWDNHQALACGYRWQETAKRLALEVYDPNHPSTPVEITMKLADPSIVRELAQSTGEPLRGLYPLHYRQVRPPWS